MLVRGMVLYDGAGLGLVPFMVATGALFLGCFAYAVLTSWTAAGRMEVIAWVVAGAVSLDALMALVFFTGPTDVGHQALTRSVVFWAFWTVVGGITGFPIG